MTIYLFADSVTDRSHKQWNDEANNVDDQWNDHYEFLNKHTNKLSNTIQIIN